MFVSYDCEAFGQRLRALRKRCGLSQSEVSNRTGMNTDTLRRIENGSVIPRYESLEMLSGLYQVNLLQVLDQCKVSNRLLQYYEELDYILLKSDAPALDRLIEQFRSETAKPQRHIQPQELTQLSQLLLFLQKSFASEALQKNEAREGLWSLLLTRHELLSLDTLAECSFTDFECKVLLVVAVLAAELGHREDSTKILGYLARYKQPTETARHTEKKMYIKALINLSYNYHLDDRHQEAHDTAQAGIEECLRYDLLYGLYILYYRRGIAELHLSLPAAESFQHAFHLLRLQRLDQLAEHYRSVLKSLYQFEVP